MVRKSDGVRFRSGSGASSGAELQGFGFRIHGGSFNLTSHGMVFEIPAEPT